MRDKFTCKVTVGEHLLKPARLAELLVPLMIQLVHISSAPEHGYSINLHDFFKDLVALPKLCDCLFAHKGMLQSSK